MTAIREFIKVKDKSLFITLPNDFNYEEVEVVILPRTKSSDLFEFEWTQKELQEIGKVGMHSLSFVKDDEDYSQW